MHQPTETVRCQNVWPDTSLTHEKSGLIDSVVSALRPYLQPDESIIWRAPFRWHDDDGVLSNHYEGQSIEYICETFDYELVHDFNHVAVIRKVKRGPAENLCQ